MTSGEQESGAGTVSWTRARLGRVGVWTGLFWTASAAEQRSAVARIESLGYGSLWSGELIGGLDAFAHAAVVLSSSSTLVAGTGIANLWARHPAAMEGAAATVGAAWPGRFVLGVGVSHAMLVDGSGLDYRTPLTRMAEYLDGMDRSAGAAPATTVPVPRVLAALGPRMLELARDHADGAHPYFVPPEHTPVAREVLGPDKLLIPEQAVVLSTDPDEARRVARAHTELYLLLPNYVNNLKRLGFTDDDVAGAGSDRLVDAIVAWGDEDAIAARVAELQASGADHVLLQPLSDTVEGALSQLEVLAPAVLG